jgi:hypothetical protein
MFCFNKLHCPSEGKKGKREREREREILLSANFLLKILIPLKASKGLFFP